MDLELKHELYDEAVRHARSADAFINEIKFDTDRLWLTIELRMEPGTPRQKQYTYSNIYLGQYDPQSLMQHIRNIVASVAKHHATLDTVDIERFHREALF